jgi:MarR family transcriptional regulator, transcriptional regulator for hemolysin
MTNGKQGQILAHDFENYVGYWICMASRAFERAMNEELAPSGITYRQCQVLAWLAIAGNLSQTDLADRLRIEPPTLVGILDRMEREGWVRRESDPHDRRRKLVVPTPKAVPVWSKIVACSDRVRARGNRGVSPAEQELLKNLLKRVIDNLPPDGKQETAADVEPITQPSARKQKSIA